MTFCTNTRASIGNLPAPDRQFATTAVPSRGEHDYYTPALGTWHGPCTALDAMLRYGLRVCDVCGGLIVSGTPYRLATLTPEAAAPLLDVDDPELVPTFTQLPDLTVRLEICLVCYLHMDGPEGAVEIR